MAGLELDEAFTVRGVILGSIDRHLAGAGNDVKPVEAEVEVAGLEVVG